MVFYARHVSQSNKQTSKSTYRVWISCGRGPCGPFWSRMEGLLLLIEPNRGLPRPLGGPEEESAGAFCNRRRVGPSVVPGKRLVLGLGVSLPLSCRRPWSWEQGRTYPLKSSPHLSTDWRLWIALSAIAPFPESAAMTLWPSSRGLGSWPEGQLPAVTCQGLLPGHFGDQLNRGSGCARRTEHNGLNIELEQTG